MLVPVTFPISWTADGQSRINPGELLTQLAGAPLHVVEVQIRLSVTVAQGAAALEGFRLYEIVEGLTVSPSQSCYRSSVSGPAIAALDWAVTGRRPVDPPQVAAGAGNETHVFTLRLPYHGGLLGAGAYRFRDLLTPVDQWLGGEILINWSGTAPWGAGTATITQATGSLAFVLRPIPSEFVVGPVIVYGESVQGAGGSALYPSVGRTIFLGLAPRDRDTSVYGDAGVREACAELIDVRDHAAAWSSVRAFSGAYLTPSNPEWAPLVYSAGGAPLWSYPRLPEGNRLISLPANTATEHRVVWAQLLGNAREASRISRETGGPLEGEGAPLRGDGAAANLLLARDVLPVTVPRIELSHLSSPQGPEQGGEGEGA